MSISELFTHPIIISIYALLVGSFLNVCIYRIPFGRPKGLASLEADEDEVEKQLKQMKEKVNIFFPRRSFCPHCKEPLKWWHNIPLFSWIFLRGKCHYCKRAISFRYPLVELLSLIIALACYAKFSGLTAVILYIFCCSLIVESFIDIDYYIIPDVISFPGMALGILFGALNHFFIIFNWPMPENVWGNLIGLIFGGGVLLLISEVYLRVRKRVGLGLGDVKLLAMTGAFFGLQGAFCTMFFGSLIGSLIGLSMMIFSSKGLNHHLPFGPYLALGTVIYIFSGPNLLFQF